MSVNAIPLFQPGGALRADAFYIERPADTELLRALLGGEFCYVLAPRQIGKSSLRARTQARLQTAGVRCAVLDLTTIGTTASEHEWYASLLGEMADQLGLGDPSNFWNAHALHTPVARFMSYLRYELLAKLPGPVVIFVDEIDLLRRISIQGEDFLAALRAIYNQRADDATCRRLTVCLIGVATPGELIADPHRTPFNIGQAIALDDFSRSEADAFLPGLLGVTSDAASAGALLDELYRWTEGHPYLMQRLCAALVDSPSTAESAEACVAALIERLFYSTQADPNLSYAEIRFADAQAPVSMIQKVSLYRRLLFNETVAADRHSRLHSELRLAGLIKDVARPQQGDTVLQVRNLIMARVFNRDWLRQRSADAQLTDAMVQWKDAGRPNDLLLRGSQLAAALQASEGREGEPDEAEFLRASLTHREREEAERRTQAEALSRQLRISVISLSVLASVLLASIFIAVGLTRRVAKAKFNAEVATKAEEKAKQDVEKAHRATQEQKSLTDAAAKKAKVEKVRADTAENAVKRAERQVAEMNGRLLEAKRSYKVAEQSHEAIDNTIRAFRELLSSMELESRYLYPHDKVKDLKRPLQDALQYPRNMFKQLHDGSQNFLNQLEIANNYASSDLQTKISPRRAN